MNNSYENINSRLNELKNAKNSVEQIAIKISGFTNKYNQLIKLIEKTDGDINKIPNSIKNVGKGIDNTKIIIMNSMPKSFGNMKVVIGGISSAAMACELLCSRYDSTLDELIKLYTEKYQIIEKLRMLDKKSVDKNNMKEEQNKKNYKQEAMKLVDLFDTYGVIDESELKNSQGSTFSLDKKSKDCVDNLNHVINNLSATEVTAHDIEEIKEILTKIKRMHVLTGEAQDREYEDIEKYIGNLAGRNMRLSRGAGESVTDNETGTKLEAMEGLGSFNASLVTNDDLLKIANIKKEELDDVGIIYLDKIIDVIKSLPSSIIMSSDVIKIKEMITKLGKTSILDEEAKNKTYEELDEFIDELESRRGYSK